MNIRKPKHSFIIAHFISFEICMEAKSKTLQGVTHASGLMVKAVSGSADVLYMQAIEAEMARKLPPQTGDDSQRKLQREAVLDRQSTALAVVREAYHRPVMGGTTLDIGL